MSDREEAPGQTQHSLARECLGVPPDKLEEVARDREV